MNILKNHDILKNISLFINFKNIWYLKIFNKKITYDDNYWNYRAKNIYNCNKINNKKDYDSYYETFFECLNNKVIKFNIQPHVVEHNEVRISVGPQYLYINKNLVEGNIFIFSELSKFVDYIQSDDFKNKYNMDKKIKYINSIFYKENNNEYIYFCHGDNVKSVKPTNCVFKLSFYSILIKKEGNEYSYTLRIFQEDTKVCPLMNE